MNSIMESFNTLLADPSLAGALPFLLVALLAALIAWYVFHAARRTRVTGEQRDVLDEGAAPAQRNQALIDAPPAAVKPLSAALPEQMPAPRAAVPPAPVAPPPPPAPQRAFPSSETATPAPPAAPMAMQGQAQMQVQGVTPSSELSRLKGVGPKLVAQLAELGVTDLAQVAEWSDADIDRIDPQLGRFQGRIRRDAWVDQARLLLAGDTAGYAARFGNIT